MARAGTNIDGAAVGFGDEHVAISVENFGGEGPDPLAFLAAGPQRELRSILIAVGSLERNAAGVGGARDELDYASERVAAVEARSSLLGDFDSGNGFGGDAIPENPAAEWIVEWDAILQDEGATGTVCAEATKRNSLRGGICGAATEAAVEAEAGDLAQRVIERERRRVLQIFASQLDVADRDIVKQSGGAIGGDLDLLADGGKLQSDFEVSGGSSGRDTPGLGQVAKTGSGDGNGSGGSSEVFEEKAAGGIGGGGRRVGFCFEADLSAGKRRTGGVANDTFDAERLGERSRNAG